MTLANGDVDARRMNTPEDVHLTPRGWENGPRPSDAAKTLRILERVPLRTAVAVRVDTVWENPDVSPEECERLERLHGPAPG